MLVWHLPRPIPRACTHTQISRLILITQASTKSLALKRSICDGCPQLASGTWMPFLNSSYKLQGYVLNTCFPYWNPEFWHVLGRGYICGQFPIKPSGSESLWDLPDRQLHTCCHNSLLEELNISRVTLLSETSWKHTPSIPTLYPGHVFSSVLSLPVFFRLSS